MKFLNTEPRVCFLFLITAVVKPSFEFNFWPGFPQKSLPMPLNRLQTLLSQESLRIGNTYYDEDLISAFPLLKSAPPEVVSYIPQIYGNSRQLGRSSFLWEGCGSEAIRNGISSSLASVFMGVLMTQFCSEKQNDAVAAAVFTSTCTPGMCDLSQAYGKDLGESSGKDYHLWKSPRKLPLKHPKDHW